MYHMRNLTYLDLSHNQIASLGTATRTKLNKISENVRLTVDLSDNPFQCNCDNVEFWRWIVASEFVKNSTPHICENGKFVVLFRNRRNLPSVVDEMSKQCASYTALIAGLSCGICATTVILSWGIVYRYRWKLRYLYFMTKSRYWGYTQVNEQSPNYVYHAFISYSDKDRFFAFHEMMRNLENIGNLSLCFHNRDFVPGSEIAQNITNAIHHSGKTICVLSPEYIRSYWCMYELNMARMKSIYSRKGDNVLFLILYKDIFMKDLPLPLMDLIKKKSYIEYPDDEQGNVVFWDKIKQTLLR